MSNPGDFAYQVKQQADIVRIIGEYVKLRKAGAQNFSGLCPFHSEKSPSFSVHATKQFFHCFGCGVSGDVFSFVQKIENSTFPEAVRTVATKMGIPLPQQQYSPAEAKEASLRGKLLDIHELATAFFEEQLRTPAGAAAREYLADRGIDQQTIDAFRIGYAPDSGFLLRDRLKNRFDEAILRQSGLFSWKEEQGSNIYSKFRNRVTFPIDNESGKVIAFTARTLSSSKDAGPKYMNSPETPIYSKGRVLFNLDKAKQAIRELDYTIVVEGQMDCIRVYTAGLHNVIASSGTAFGEAQIKLLGRYSKNIIVNFDPDTAGAAATERSLVALIEEDFNVRVLSLDAGLDPDLFIRQRGVDAYKIALRDSRKYFHYLIDRAQQQFPGRSAEAKVKQVNFLLPHIQRVPNNVARDEIVADAGHRLDIDPVLLRDFKSSVQRRSSQRVQAPAITRHQKTEENLLRALLGNAGESAEEAEDLRNVVYANLREHGLFRELPHAELIKQVLNVIAEERDPLQSIESTEERHLLSRLVFEDTPLTRIEVEGALQKLRGTANTREIDSLQEQVEKTSAKDPLEAARLMQEKLERLKQPR